MISVISTKSWYYTPVAKPLNIHTIIVQCLFNFRFPLILFINEYIILSTHLMWCIQHHVTQHLVPAISLPRWSRSNHHNLVASKHMYVQCLLQSICCHCPNKPINVLAVCSSDLLLPTMYNYWRRRRSTNSCTFIAAAMNLFC